MLGNWSVILNVLLLAGVFFAIARTIKSRRENLSSNYVQPLVGQPEDIACDDIIAVRKVSPDPYLSAPTISTSPRFAAEFKTTREKPVTTETGPSPVMMFLLAKGDRQLAGYELLQTLLSVGLRFGEGHLFHRHQHSNGQGPVLCSVAAATSTGMFDLQNIGAFSVRGLCIFMEASGSSAIDEERFAIMLATARQLSEDLDAYLLDDNRQPLTDATLARYYRLLNLEVASAMEMA